MLPKGPVKNTEGKWKYMYIYKYIFKVKIKEEIL